VCSARCAPACAQAGVKGQHRHASATSGRLQEADPAATHECVCVLARKRVWVGCPMRAYVWGSGKQGRNAAAAWQLHTCRGAWLMRQRFKNSQLVPLHNATPSDLKAQPAAVLPLLQNLQYKLLLLLLISSSLCCPLRRIRHFHSLMCRRIPSPALA